MTLLEALMTSAGMEVLLFCPLWTYSLPLGRYTKTSMQVALCDGERFEHVMLIFHMKA